MDKYIYDVLKMQNDDLTKLLDDEEKRVQEGNGIVNEANEALELSDDFSNECLECLKEYGVFLDDEIVMAHKRADEEADLMIDDINRKNNHIEIKEASYEELVDKAHARGYVDTKIENILSEEEIQSADKRLENIEAEFQEITKLEKIDIAFLTTAIVLQVVRQYCITPFTKRSDADEGGKIMKKRYGDDGKLKGKYYYATEETIVGQKKVPFDTISGSKKYGIGKDGKGLDGNSHRFRSLGHDPILGYIFGTANIITNTATWWNGTSHHIRYQSNARGIMVPTIVATADTGKVFDAVVDRYNEKNGKKILVEAVVKEHLHLKSDITTAGLPIPFLQVFSPDLAQLLAEAGLDAIALEDIEKQANIAEVINFIIATIHSLLCREAGEEDCKMYMVRTKKIILMSNVIASTSNVIAVGIATAVGIKADKPKAVKEALRYFDVGGLLDTILHLFTDLKFISQVKEEFVNARLDALFIEKLNELDKCLAN